MTPGMIQAGTRAALDEIGTFKMWPNFDAAHFVTAIYEAMRPHAPKASTFTMKIDTSELQAQLAAFTASVNEFKAAVEAATVEG